ncbi:hypothetical protein MHBO_000239 [Bonamia ostreae]|uniref:BEACH domain-containing protein n=1 Tax=Bonamia ostreae TaxID=126728 RepID=A0ABV2AF02_9EUKA
MTLNTLSGRSYNDLSQYPIFPWILKDYKSHFLDLNDSNSFRDLSLPMGCIDPNRKEFFDERFELWGENSDGIPKFHYGTHYSTPGIVLYYLLRLEPFTKLSLELQGGMLDVADRVFASIERTWESASSIGGLSDVRELIPEFFYLPQFLENGNFIDFGRTQSDVPVRDVLLPPWALGSPKIFIHKHREALESEYVSLNLHKWIDLIFGYKQKGEEAIKNRNVFYYLTYQENVKIESICDQTEKKSILAQIKSFGQCPFQLFNTPHLQKRTILKNVTDDFGNNDIETDNKIEKNGAENENFDKNVSTKTIEADTVEADTKIPKLEKETSKLSRESSLVNISTIEAPKNFPKFKFERKRLIFDGEKVVSAKFNRHFVQILKMFLIWRKNEFLLANFENGKEIVKKVFVNLIDGDIDLVEVSLNSKLVVVSFNFKNQF